MPEKVIPADIITQQNNHIKEYAKQKGWTIKKKYTDRKNDFEAEDAFQILRTDGIARKFDLVIVDSIFRFGRGVPFAEDVLLKAFYPANIHFAVVEDNFYSAEYSLKELKEYFKRQKYKAVNMKLYNWNNEQQKRGILSVHEEKYGYLFNSDRTGFVIDEEAAVAIKEMFQLLGEGKRYKEIAEIMNERKYETPIQHLNRVGKKNHGSSNGIWTLESVRRIVNNKVYLGGYEKIVDGEKMFIDTPVLVDEATFKMGREQIESRGTRIIKSGKRSTNAFMNRIFDKDTENPLFCHLVPGPPEHQAFHRHGYNDKKGIEYEIIMTSVISSLKNEKDLAETVFEFITSENGEEQKRMQKQILSEMAKKIFAKNSAIEQKYIPLFQKYEKGDISEAEYLIEKEKICNQMELYEQEFKIIMNRVDEIDTCFSARNPWIHLYKNITIPKQLTGIQVRKWIARVEIEDFQKIEVFFLKQEWKKMLS